MPQREAEGGSVTDTMEACVNYCQLPGRVTSLIGRYRSLSVSLASIGLNRAFSQSNASCGRGVGHVDYTPHSIRGGRVATYL